MNRKRAAGWIVTSLGSLWLSILFINITVAETGYDYTGLWTAAACLAGLSLLSASVAFGRLRRSTPFGAMLCLPLLCLCGLQFIYAVKLAITVW